MDQIRKRFKSAAATRRILNIWPPLLFSGIHILELSDDFRRIKSCLRDRPGTRNIHGAQFGGSLFSLTDAVYAVMLNGLLSEKYFVWDSAAHIDFIKPGMGEVYVDCCVTDEMLDDIYKHTQNGEKYFPEYEVRIFDQTGETVAIAKRTLYIRLKPEFRPQENAGKK